jgi:uncharacterized peroxidase-related enzyme
MPLVDPLPEDHDPEVARLAEFFNVTLGFPPNSVLTMMRRPEIARSFTALNRAVMECRGKLTPELKRLIGALASLTAGCRYCQAHTILAAERFGSTPERLADIWVYERSPHFNDAEKAAFDFAVAAAHVPNGVTRAIGEKLRRHWDDGDIVEILGVIALFGYLNRWNDSMATVLEAPGEETAMRNIARHGWEKGKHA